MRGGGGVQPVLGVGLTYLCKYGGNYHHILFYPISDHKLYQSFNQLYPQRS